MLIQFWEPFLGKKSKKYFTSAKFTEIDDLMNLIRAPHQAMEGAHSIMQVMSLKFKLHSVQSKSTSGLMYTAELGHEVEVIYPSKPQCD